MSTPTLAIALAALASLTLAAAPAHAKKRHKDFYVETFTTSVPVRGYEGFYGIGKHQLYCSYVRVPNRECWITSSGRERCKVVSWQLEQRCY